MIKHKQKLELTWVGKDERPKLEPRILIEDPTLSYHADKRYGDNDQFDNILIQGDNLLALKALEQDYTGKVKCIYIDPPYNINAATPYYEDGLAHSEWLNRMSLRLILLQKLLTEDGLIFVQIDDDEMAYLTVLMDEIFGRENRVNIISVKMSEASGVKMAHVKRRLPKLKEFVLVYCKSRSFEIDIEHIFENKWNDEYKTLVCGLNKSELEELKNLISGENHNDQHIEACNEILNKVLTVSLSDYFTKNNIANSQREDWKFENAYRIIQVVGSSSVLNLARSQPKLDQEIAAALSSSGLIYLYKTSFDASARQPRVQVIFADQNLSKNPGDFWADIKTTGGVGQEGGVLFPNGKKPEVLLKRIVGMVTDKNDIVLDSFGGSGTTAAVAHKMGRRWIMVELGNHAQTHIVPRLKKVIDGEDKSGVTEATGWKGGGGFRFYRLAPSLLEEDKYGRLVISKDYNPAMLSEAMCKLMGFTYAPSDEDYWNHGYSHEQSHIYVTTNRLTHDYLSKVAHDVGPLRSLLICCKAFEGEPDAFDNLTVVKIPQAVLDQCEWGKDDYSLNVQNLPMAESEQVVMQENLFEDEGGDDA